MEKEVRGLGEGTNFGSICGVSQKEIFSFTLEWTYALPWNLFDRFDGKTVYFMITKEEAEQYKYKSGSQQ